MNKTAFRLAHISDLHFAFIKWDIKQFFTKRWLGNLNLTLFRRFGYQTAHLAHIPGLLETLLVDMIFVTGDFASTSLDEEFQLASAFLEKFLMPVYSLPGNHDFYTADAEKEKRFYRYFKLPELESIRIEKKPLVNGWWWVGLDCAHATPPFCSYGTFFPEMEETLKHTLNDIPAHAPIILGNHFPLFGTGRPRHDLACAERLQQIVREHPQIKLYLHGHDHSPYILNEEGYPLTLNSGSCAHFPGGTFYLIDLFQKECFVQRLYFKPEAEWVIDFQQNYKFR